MQAEIGAGKRLPLFFSGHTADGAPARSGKHKHLAFLFDAPRRRLIVVAPHVLDRRDAKPKEREWLAILERALADFSELRAGTAGKLTLAPSSIGAEDDVLFARARVWESLTPYCVTRHAKTDHAAAALEADLVAECLRGGLPRPQIEVSKTFGRRGLGLSGFVRLKFHGVVEGPLLLGRDRHFGGGVFAAADRQSGHSSD